MVQLLIEAGVDANTTVSGMSPLFVAASCGDLGIVELLLNNGGSMAASHNATCCERAVEMGDVGKAGEVTGAELEGWWCDGATPLMIACLRSNVEVVGKLLERGADVLQKDASDRTCMFYAARSGSEECIKTVIEKGGEGLDLNAGDAAGRSALMDASRSGVVRAVEILLAAGCDPSAEGMDGGGRDSEASSGSKVTVFTEGEELSECENGASEGARAQRKERPRPQLLLRAKSEEQRAVLRQNRDVLRQNTLLWSTGPGPHGKTSLPRLLDLPEDLWKQAVSLSGCRP